MRTPFVMAACLGFAALSATTSAGIPVPGIILFGQVCLDGGPATDQDDVTVIARAEVDAQVQEVGRYKMGENQLASDCHGEDDCHVLKIRLQIVPPAESVSDNAVVLDRASPAAVQVFVVQGQALEQQVAEILADDAGVIRRLDLSGSPKSADLNGDGHKSLADYGVLRASLQGPGVPSVVACNPADINGDGRVDIRDFSIMQATFSGTTP